MGGSISPIRNPHLWKSYVFRKVPYHSHTWEWYGYGMIAMRGNAMGAYISPIPNPHLWERDHSCVFLNSIKNAGFQESSYEMFY